MAAGPTQRTLQRLRSQGWNPAVTEKWNPATKIRNDLFGFIDVLAIRGCETLAVQATTSSNAAARRKKIAALENFRAVLAAGWAIEVHGWYKNAANRWVCNVYQMTHEHAASQDLPP